MVVFYLTMNNFAILVWNVRCLNDPHRRDTLRSLINCVMPTIVCIQETKMNSISHWDVASCLGSEFGDFVFLPSSGTRGGILIAWRRGLISAIDSKIHNHSVLVCFMKENSTAWWFSGVYGPHRVEEKLAFLEELSLVRTSCPGPWVIAGDFNMIRCTDDKSNSNINRTLMDNLNIWINNHSLKELPLTGRRFT
jgi:exonuclease III